MILIDADALIGSRVENDAHHKKSVELLSKLREASETLITSWQVVDEVATKLSYFTTKKKAKEFLNWVFTTNIKVVYVDEKLGKKVIKLFNKIRSKRVSLTDCTNVVVAKEMRVKKVFSFDKVYERNGLELLSDGKE